VQFSYAAEKFAKARRYLSLPNAQGEHQSIASAFGECILILRNLDESTLDDYARTLVAELRVLMNTEGVDDPAGEGTFSMKARGFSSNERSDVSRVIDELAVWFDSQP